jgi:hypothetical protein
LEHEAHKKIKNSVPASQKPYPMSPLQRPVKNAVREIIAVDARNLTKHTNILYGQNAEFGNVRVGGVY